MPDTVNKSPVLRGLQCSAHDFKANVIAAGLADNGMEPDLFSFRNYFALSISGISANEYARSVGRGRCINMLNFILPYFFRAGKLRYLLTVQYGQNLAYYQWRQPGELFRF